MQWLHFQSSMSAHAAEYNQLPRHRDGRMLQERQIIVLAESSVYSKTLSCGRKFIVFVLTAIKTKTVVGWRPSILGRQLEGIPHWQLGPEAEAWRKNSRAWWFTSAHKHVYAHIHARTKKLSGYVSAMFVLEQHKA